MTQHVLTTPIGRLVGGSLYEGKTTDADDKPLVYKTGAKAGQARVEFSFAIAVPKTQVGQHWASEAWLRPVWDLAAAAFPAGESQRRDFSWKIIDGDSQEPNKKMKRPCDQEGYPGHWVVWFSGSTAPRVFNRDGSQLLTEPGAVKKGYYIQVCGSVDDNKPSQTPGLYWNHSMVAMAAYGPEIASGPDVGTAKFGQGVSLPAGASLAPPAGALPVGAPGAPPVFPPVVGGPPAPGAPALPPGPGMTPPPPPPPPAAPVAPVYTMTAAAGGWTREALLAAGHTDASMLAQGLMLAATPAPAPLPPSGGFAPPPPAAASIAVVPNPQFTQMVPPPAAGAPVPPPLPPALPNPGVALTPTAAAQGRTLAELLAMPGWNIELLKQHGLVV